MYRFWIAQQNHSTHRTSMARIASHQLFGTCILHNHACIQLHYTDAKPSPHTLFLPRSYASSTKRQGVSISPHEENPYAPQLVYGHRQPSYQSYHTPGPQPLHTHYANVPHVLALQRHHKSKRLVPPQMVYRGAPQQTTDTRAHHIARQAVSIGNLLANYYRNPESSSVFIR